MTDAPREAEAIITGGTSQAPGNLKTGPEGTPAQAFTTDTQISSMADLKQKAPELHQAMLEGIAHSIVRSMQQHGRRFKKLMREGYQK